MSLTPQCIFFYIFLMSCVDFGITMLVKRVTLALFENQTQTTVRYADSKIPYVQFFKTITRTTLRRIDTVFGSLLLSHSHTHMLTYPQKLKHASRGRAGF